MGRPLAAPEAHAEGLVLTEDGAAGPQQKKTSALQGWQLLRKGWKPNGRDKPTAQARFTTARPEGMRKNSKHTDSEAVLFPA